MPFAPGDVVVLKSGGQPMTAVAIEDDTVECIWMGEQGEYFREMIPAIALVKAADIADEDDEEEEPDEEDDDAER
jgi:uncharacterized protein YodC (DUF2158 family)